MREFYLYILKCSDGSYYTGHTDDLEARLALHQRGEISGYTFGRRPVELAFAQGFPSREEVLQAERQVKGWARRKKEALMRQDWEALRRLARKTRSP